MDNRECQQCHNIACSACLQQWLQRDRSCPTCKASVHVEDEHFKHNVPVERMADRTPVDCPFACDQSGTIARGDLSAHTERYCPMRPIPCDMQKFGCQWSGVMSHLEDHMQQECRLWPAREALQSLEQEVDKWRTNAHASYEREDNLRKQFLKQQQQQPTASTSTYGDHHHHQMQQKMKELQYWRDVSNVWLDAHDVDHWRRMMSVHLNARQYGDALVAMILLWRELGISPSSAHNDTKSELFHGIKRVLEEDMKRTTSNARGRRRREQQSSGSVDNLLSSTDKWLSNLINVGSENVDDSVTVVTVDHDWMRVLLLCRGLLRDIGLHDPHRAEQDFRRLCTENDSIQIMTRKTRALVALAHFSLGRILYNRRQMNDAERILSKAIALDHGLSMAYNSRAALYRAQMKNQEALNDFNRAIEINPHNYRALNNRGMLLKTLHQYDAALRDFNTVISINASHISAYKNRALLYDDHYHQFERALADYDTVLHHNPSDAEVQQRRNALLARVGPQYCPPPMSQQFRQQQQQQQRSGRQGESRRRREGSDIKCNQQ